MEEQNDARYILNQANFIDEIYLTEYPMKKMILLLLANIPIAIMFHYALKLVGPDFRYAHFESWAVLTFLKYFCLIMPFITLPLYFMRRNKLKNKELYIVKDKVTKKIEKKIYFEGKEYYIFGLEFEKFSGLVDLPIYVISLDYGRLNEGDECYIFLPSDFKKAKFLNIYYNPISVLNAKEYKLDDYFNDKVISAEDYIKDHFTK